MCRIRFGSLAQALCHWQTRLSRQPLAYKKDCVIVDVGINRNEEGKLRGDAVAGLPVALQTPVPGGVGLLTRLALVKNLIIAAKSR